MRALLMLIFSFVFSFTLQASIKTDPPNLVFYSFRWQTVDFDGFNRQTKDLFGASFPDLQNQILEMGASYQWRDGRWVNDLGVAVGWQNQSETLGSANLLQGALRLGITYSILKRTDWTFGPTVIFNLQFSQLSLGTPGAIASLSQITQVNTLKINQFDIPTRLGLNLQRNIQIPSGNLIGIGLITGYQLSDEDSWNVDSATNIDNPGIDLDGFFASVRFGFQIK